MNPDRLYPAAVGSVVFDYTRLHACNCIGCCQKCGECRTDPKHTAEHCAAVQAWRASYPRHRGTYREGGDA